MPTDLAAALAGLHGAPYARYRSLEGAWPLPVPTAAGTGHAELRVVRVQADPFAPPSRFELHAGADVLAAPAELWNTPVRARALASWLARRAAALAPPEVHLDAGGQEVLRRTSCEVHGGAVVLRFAAHLPGPRRRADGRAAARTLTRDLPALAAEALHHPALDAAGLTGRLRRWVDTVEDSDTLRRRLPALGLVAFVPDGAVLARRSGVDPRPAEGAVPFTSPPELRVEVDLPHRGRTTGMGVPQGVTLVVGGGFSGKSTLLRALEAGVHDHAPGDGRELVVTRPDAVAVRAEDGRAVTRVDVGAFVAALPGGLDPADLTTAEASGSTSQAAAVVEAVEAGAGVLLLDEDTTATNLMVRDARMQALVAKEREPLNPFVDLVRSLHRDRGVSTVLVAGSSGDYLDVADRVVLMDDWRAADATARAREVAARPTGRVVEAGGFPAVRHRVVDPGSVRPVARGRVRVSARGTDTLLLGEHEVDVRALRQLVDAPHVVGVGLALARLVAAGHLRGRSLARALDLLDADLAETGGPEPVARLLGGVPVDAVVPRRFEVAAALDRLRELRVLRLLPEPGT
ncbi:ABC-ATPase domain-containing protein [Kineococcus sp. NUM-3379]